ncbi:MAG: MHYT domain-containing protein [Vicinamibacterales bacterium]|jgi:PAS domain S-box-containing protein
MSDLTPGASLTGSYDPLLVVLSLVIAVVASYVSFDLAGRVTASTGIARLLWRLGGASTMGLGIWSMHFTGMLAFTLPVPMVYRLDLVAASIVIAIAASALSLWLVCRPLLTRSMILAGGVVMGLAIAAMHYTGMAAMDLPARIEYSPLLFTASLLIAVIASTAALAFAYAYRDDLGPHRMKRRAASALAMGGGICGMHFVGMLAASFYVIESPGTWTPGGGLDPHGLSGTLVIAAMVLLGTTLVAAMLDRRLLAAEGFARQQQRVFDVALSSLSDFIYVFDRDGRFVYSNQALLTMFGLGLEQVVGKTFGDLQYPAEVAARLDGQIQEVFRTGHAIRDETPLTFANGTFGVYEYIFHPVATGHGRVDYVAGSSRDITDLRRRAQETQRQARQQAALAALGQRALAGASTAHLTDLAVQAVATTLSVPVAEVRALSAEGGTLRMVAGPGPFSADDTLFLQAMANVLAEAIRRERAETEATAVRARLEQQAELLDKARDAILVRDLSHRITYLNKSAERVFGWSAAEALGQSTLDLFEPDSGTRDHALETLHLHGEWVGELRRKTKAGETLFMDCRWTLVRNAGGDAQAVLMIETDVTERRKLEQQFLRAQRMESIGTLAGGIAHDLNNVLAPIMMSISLLREGEGDPVKLEMLDTINASAHRGADMVKQVLLFARGVDGQRVQVRVAPLMQDIEKIVKDAFPKNIQVINSSEANLPLVAGDPTQLHQVLINLCVNARDAMPGGGTLKMSARQVTLDAQYAALEGEVAPGPYVEITVADTGTGISPESLDKVFEPFFTTKAVGKGTGLGLSTSLAIVRSHGGFIRAYSEPGLGTTFRLCLPVSEAAASAPGPAEHAELPRGQGELLLVVDDEAAVRQITGQTLEAFGYRVVLASDGAEAVAVYAMRRHEIAAVIIDIMMPVMDGPAAIQALLGMNPQVRIVVASGLNTTGRVAGVAAAGVSLFLPKPYSADALLKIVRKALQEPR